ncbi:MAG: FlgD immunoglobulin-like domain containing protein, partial [Candidatus Krumholzibacteria bacterium]|nr:FlgD immunoglobulin-like domain containing protein [Candidatus Krumholzibacteria bacterium]
NGLGTIPFEGKCFGRTFWFTGLDGYLCSADTTSWESAAVARVGEDLDATRSWIFRLATGAGREYALGLTILPPAEHDGCVNSIGLGATLYGDGTIFPSFGTGCTPADGTALATGIHDIRITWDPSAGQARFEAAPVASWIDSLSDFPQAAVWTACASAPLLPPAWLQINLKGITPRIYDVWSLPAAYEPSPLLSRYSAEGRAAGVWIEWAFAAPPGGDECVILRCAAPPRDCETIARIPLIAGATVFHWLDTEARPGSDPTYRVYLGDGAGLALLFDTGPVIVPRAAAALFQNHPNPFNPSTTIEWYLPEAARARVGIFDVSGRVVRRLFDGRCPAGRSAVSWDGCGDGGAPAAAGVYFCRISSGEFEQARKMVLLP